MKKNTQIEILTNLMEINNDRVIIYSLVKNEIIYEDLKSILAACIKSSFLYKEQLEKERNRLATKTKYETVPNQDFFNVWLVINDCLSVHKREMISSLFADSEAVFKNKYDNALNKQNLKYLSTRNKRLIDKQKRLLKTG